VISESNMKYISILRGINVSGRKKIKMAELKELYESLGFINVITYIQSGNVIFESDEENSEKIKSKIEEAIIRTYDFHVPIIIRTIKDFSELIRCNPFSPVDLEKDGSRILVTFLTDSISGDHRELLMKFKSASESFEIMEKHICLHCPDGYGKTKLSNAFLEKKLNVTATTRNWKTVLKLYELSN